LTRIIIKLLLFHLLLTSCETRLESENLSNNPVKSVAVQPRPLVHKIHELPTAKVHTLLIPNQSKFKIDVAVSETLKTVEDFAQETEVIAVLNGGFFDPVNSQTTSYVIKQGEVIANPSNNSRLMDNPQLQPYLKQILNRSEFRRYQCGELTRYAITYHQEPVPENCQLTSAIGGGPQLLPNLSAEEEAFFESVNGKVTRDPLGVERANARTAIGITSSGDVLWIMVEQKSPSNGLSLLELRDFLESKEVTSAMNLDGGSSSSFFYQGDTFYGKKSTESKVIKRPIKSVLLLLNSVQ
jgi:exopolysaccharide biosynthesis protein